jgi:hypothetical protein
VPSLIVVTMVGDTMVAPMNRVHQLRARVAAGTFLSGNALLWIQHRGYHRRDEELRDAEAVI